MTQPFHFTPGTVFADDFEIERPLSQGGMGAVYVVRQRSTRKQRALKLMHPQLVANAQLRRRFEDEATIGSRIESDHVVEVISAGVDAATRMPWLAMELLRGKPLSDYVRDLPEQRVGVPELRAILGQVGHALAAAHREGIVHRDLKPENLFRVETRVVGGAPFVMKILDFGIAKVRSESGTANVTDALGTPLWMAIEQMSRGDTIRPATDVWSLGLIAFWLLTGRSYWRTPNEKNESVHKIVREICVDPIDPASLRAAELGAGGVLPPWFDAWFARCVCRQVEERFEDAGVAVAALEAAASGATAPHVAPAARPQVSLASTSLGVATMLPGAVPALRAAVASEPAIAAGPGTQLNLGRTFEAEGATDGLAEPRPSRPKWPIAVGGIAVLAFGLGAFFATREAPAPAVPSASVSPAIAPPATAPPMTSRAEAPPTNPRLGKLIPVPAARVRMGSRIEKDEQPEHNVAIAAFSLQETEVTVAAFARCVEDKGCKAPEATVWAPDLTPEEAKLSVHCAVGHPDRAEHPINCVTWDQAKTYCAWAGGRLPTEPEWELAARGTSRRTYPWGEEPPGETRLNACDGACSAALKEAGSAYPKSDGYTVTAPVGRFPAGKTPEGILDMAGNVSEWVDTVYGPYPGGVLPSSASERRVSRGGSSSSSPDAQDCRH